MSPRGTPQVWPGFNAKCVAEQRLVPTYEAVYQDPQWVHFGLKGGDVFVTFCLQVYKGKMFTATEQTVGCGRPWEKSEVGYGMQDHARNESNNSFFN